jgi:hypothetical protein
MAKEGYAVGALNFGATEGWAKFQVVFMKITKSGLDPADSYKSRWIRRPPEKYVTVGGDGRPVIGIFGALDGTKVAAVGLIQPGGAGTEALPLVVKTETSAAGGGGGGLLGKVDTVKHAVKGKWTKNEDGELVGAPAGCARIVLPAESMSRYHMRAEFTRTSGNGSVNIIFPAGAGENSGQSVMTISGWGGTINGLDMVDGKRASDNPSTRKGRSIETGTRYRLDLRVVQMGREGANVMVMAQLNGRQLVRWSGKPGSLKVPSEWRLPSGNSFGLGAFSSGVIFHSVKINRMPGGPPARRPGGRPGGRPERER